METQQKSEACVDLDKLPEMLQRFLFPSFVGRAVLFEELLACDQRFCQWLPSLVYISPTLRPIALGQTTQAEK